MKKLSLCAFICFFSFLYAKEMNLYNNYEDIKEFEKLTLEEQYTSYINSFKPLKDPKGQPIQWARIMIKQHKRDILPFLESTLDSFSLDYLYKEPYDSTARCLQIIFEQLRYADLLTTGEKTQYIAILDKKLDEYILKHKIVDGTLYFTQSMMNVLNAEKYDYDKSDSALKRKYEKKLKISGISVNRFKT
ncbi:MAG: hypothetical protein J6Y75_05145 [Spirochaetaceae bacterium]|nr:hypothetical protein [Spirochaetaceae bacterium]